MTANIHPSNMDHVEITFFSDNQSTAVFSVNSGATLSILDLKTWKHLATDRRPEEDLRTYANRISTRAGTVQEIPFLFNSIPAYDNEEEKFTLDEM